MARLWLLGLVSAVASAAFFGALWGAAYALGLGFLCFAAWGYAALLWYPRDSPFKKPEQPSESDPAL